MAKKFIIKSLSYVVNGPGDIIDPARPEDLSRPDSEEKKNNRELEGYLNETDPCSKVQKLLNAIESGKHHVLNEARFFEIGEFLIKANIITRANKLGRNGKLLISLKRGDTQFISFCVGVVEDIRNISTKTTECIDEIMNTFVDKNLEVVLVNEGLHQIDDKVKYFLELLGILSKAERFSSSSSSLIVYGKPITENGKVVLRSLNDKIKPVGEKKIGNSFNFLNNFKFLSDNRFLNNAVDSFKNKTIVNVPISTIVNFSIKVVFVIIFIYIFIFMVKWVLDLLPTSLL